MSAESGGDMTFEVVIVGGGPVGCSLANLLGQQGVRTLVIEKQDGVTPFPRAVVLDDESMRMLQSMKVADELVPNLAQNPPLRYLSDSGKVLVDIVPRQSRLNWPVRNMFLQPQLEQLVRDSLPAYPSVQFLGNHELLGLEQSEDGVSLEVRDLTSDTIKNVTCDFAVGADGGRSFVRQLLDVKMVGRTYKARWLVFEAKDSGVNAPYSALHCRPSRPYYTGHLPHGYRRWELMVLPGEREEDLVSREGLRTLVTPLVPSFDDLEITTPRIYTHHARIAEKFQVDRVFLAGDSAHMMPPWAGQGLNSGMRDAANLAWKLGFGLRSVDYRDLLETYHEERFDHAKAMISLSHRLGAVFMPRNRAVAKARDVGLLGAQWLPGVRGYIKQMKFKKLPYYEQGFVYHGKKPNDLVGRMIPQPFVLDDHGERKRLDDVLGYRFSVVIRNREVMDRLSGATRRRLDALDPGWFVLSDQHGDSSHELKKIVDEDGTLADWFAQVGADVALVRPDRYVAAAAPLDGFDSAVRWLMRRI